MRGGEDGSTIGARLMVHLSRYSRFKDDYVCPREMTQRGIAEKLGISREHAAAELSELRGHGHVTSKVAHVPRARTKRKVFYLTAKGECFVRQLKETVKAEGFVSPERAKDRAPASASAASV